MRARTNGSQESAKVSVTQAMRTLCSQPGERSAMIHLRITEYRAAAFPTTGAKYQGFLLRPVWSATNTYVEAGSEKDSQASSTAWCEPNGG